MSRFDVAIVGAGPGGLFAAWELKDSGLDVVVVEKGKAPLERESVNHGVGGAGAFSDGKLNLTSEIGGDPRTFNRKPGEVSDLIDKVEEVFVKFGAPEENTKPSGEKLEKLERKARECGVEFIAAEQKHTGTDRLQEVMHNFYEHLLESGIEFRLGEEVEEIDKEEDFVLYTDRGEIRAKHLIVVPGRAGAYWLRDQAENLGVKSHYGPIDVGVRVEFPNEIYEPVKEVMYDAKFTMYTKTYDDFVRTFCTNPGGFVSKEKYDSFTLVNGHAASEERTRNTNFAILDRTRLTNPIEDTTEYGRGIASLANLLGGGKPIVQRLKDIERGQRSTWDRIERSEVEPTLRDVTPGDICMALPERVVTNVLEAIEKLNHIMPGLNTGGTLIYAPEIKFYDTKYEVDRWMETNQENLYVAGDASGHSRGIVFAGVTGILAARGVEKKES
ncbi:MAG: NAD(P)/FAD-dependent oxidoreductase [Candidatus Aenigmatarchaeota archaeon]